MTQENVVGIGAITETEYLEASSDPLSKERKIARRITNTLESAGTHLTINILGTLHIGKPGITIEELISRSDIVTFELPSQVIAGIDSKERDASENQFWSEVIEMSMSEERKILGVNNNRSAVNGIRVLEQRTRRNQQPFEDTPDVVISGSHNFAQPVSEPQMVIIEGKNVISEIRDSFQIAGAPPSFHQIEQDTSTFMQFNREIGEQESLRVLVLPEGLQTPMEFLLGEISGKAEASIDVEDLLIFQNAIGHLMRLRVDKTQVKGLLSAVDKRLKRSEGGHGDVVVTHIGGAAHNPNLIAILEDLFDSPNVTISEVVDDRIFRLAPDYLTFFCSKEKLGEGLGSTEIKHDQILIKTEQARQLISTNIQEGRNEVERLRRVDDLVAQYSYVRNGMDSLALDEFVARKLLSFFPEDYDLGTLPTINKAFAKKLSKRLRRLFPRIKDEIDEVMSAHRNVRKNFPG